MRSNRQHLFWSSFNKILKTINIPSQIKQHESLGADIGNAYLEATTKEKLYIVAGPEFEELQGHILVVLQALSGLKSSGLRWSWRIHDIMLQFSFRPCKTDPCVWLREMKDKYKYIAVYVDDLLIVSEELQKIIQDLKEEFKLKIKGDGPLEYHLGCDYKLDQDGTLVAQPIRYINDRIPSTTPGADPPRDVRDSGSARSHSTHIETSSSDRP